jgi:hypothetical protein
VHTSSFATLGRGSNASITTIAIAAVVVVIPTVAGEAVIVLGFFGVVKGFVR